MAPISRGKPGKSEPDLSKILPFLMPPINEEVLGRLRISLETLLSEKTHPMINNLKRQLDLLKHAELVLQHEIESRELSLPAPQGLPSAPAPTHNQPPTDTLEADPNHPKANDPDANELNEYEIIDANKTEGSVGATPGFGEPAASVTAGETAAPPFSDTKNLKDWDEESASLRGTDCDDPPANGNGKFVPNPKAEYVESQELPVTQFELFEDDVGTEDEEQLKRKLGVVSFPKEDLSTLTAGPVPMEDFTNARPASQLQFSTYASFLEPYFRSFSDEDIQFLQQPSVSDGTEAANLRGGKKLSAFTFPPLGPHYKHQWAVQDAELSGREAPKEVMSEFAQQYLPRRQLAALDAQSVESAATSVSMGPLTERLVAAIFPEARDEPAESNGSADATGRTIPYAHGHPVEDFAMLEERVKSEFRYVGLLDISLLRKFDKNKSEFKLAVPPPRDDFADPTAVDIDWANGAEDDEISRELRVLQRKLRTVSQRNVQYKEKLLPVIKDQLALQEYQSILQDLDKQVDQAYLRRLKAPKVAAPKHKKKKIESPDDLAETRVPDQKPAIKALMDKRARWIRSLEPLFAPRLVALREYERPKFDLVDDEDFDDDDDEQQADD